MTTIAIIGMGLIGTSLGMALRSADEKKSPLGHVVITGYDQNSKATSSARGRLAIDRQANTLKACVHNAQIVVLATPVQSIRELCAQLAGILPAGTVVTDVASTKAQVCAWARELLPAHIAFVGGHPMAGKEQSGADRADPNLFHDAIYCLTPHHTTPQHALDIIETLVTTIGAKPYYLDPEEHDAYVAGISHLPVLLSTALVDVTSHSAGWREMALLAASGFRDVSRLASGDPTMYRDICITNRTALIRWINDTISCLGNMREHLEQGDVQAIEQFFARVKHTRDNWQATKTNLRPGEEPLEQIHRVKRPGFFRLR